MEDQPESVDPPASDEGVASDQDDNDVKVLSFSQRAVQPLATRSGGSTVNPETGSINCKAKGKGKTGAKRKESDADAAYEPPARGTRGSPQKASNQ
jgi:hypothetical protein